MAPRLLGLELVDGPEAWAGAGFSVEDDRCHVGGVVLGFGGDGVTTGGVPSGAVLGWSIGGLPAGTGRTLDGIPLLSAPAAAGVPASAAGSAHPNGVVALDHVVVVSSDRTRTLGALAAVGLEPRRTRDVTLAGAPHQQTFFLLGGPVLELVTPVEPAGDGPARCWGLAFTVTDLDATAVVLGERLGPVRPAVQPGRRIASLRHGAAGIGVPVAFLSARDA